MIHLGNGYMIIGSGVDEEKIFIEDISVRSNDIRNQILDKNIEGKEGVFNKQFRWAKKSKKGVMYLYENSKINQDIKNFLKKLEKNILLQK